MISDPDYQIVCDKSTMQFNMRWEAAVVEKDGSLDLFFFQKSKVSQRGCHPARKEKKRKKVPQQLTIGETDKKNICTTIDYCSSLAKILNINNIHY